MNPHSNSVICGALEAHLARTVAQGKKKGKVARLVATLSQPIDTLGLFHRALYALLGHGIQYVYALASKSRRDISRIPNIGPRSLRKRKVEDTLTPLSLTLGMTLDKATYRAAVVQAHLTTRRAADEGKEG